MTGLGDKLSETVTQAQGGDREALQTLFTDSYNSVYFFALRITRNSADAADITQDVFLSVQKHIGELREPCAYYKWLNQITAHRCADLLRGRHDWVEWEEKDDALIWDETDHFNAPDKTLEDEAKRQIILDIIDALPLTQRVCVMYFYYQQMSVSQIAAVLQINENTVKSRLMLARAKIKAALEELERKEGIRLYVFPIPLYFILLQAMREMSVPDGAQVDIQENPSGATSGQIVPKPGGITDKINGAAKYISAHKPLAVIVAAVLTAALIGGAVLLSRPSAPGNVPANGSTSGSNQTDPRNTANGWAGFTSF